VKKPKVEKPKVLAIMYAFYTSASCQAVEFYWGLIWLKCKLAC